MVIKLFLVQRLDHSAVKPLASLIYSNVMVRRAVTQVKISDKAIEFVRPLFMTNPCVPLQTEGLECRNGIIFATTPNESTSSASDDSSPSVSDDSSHYCAIIEALRRLSDGYLTEVTV